MTELLQAIDVPRGLGSLPDPRLPDAFASFHDDTSLDAICGLRRPEQDHVPLNDQCGLCGYFFRASDATMALMHSGTKLRATSARQHRASDSPGSYKIWLFCDVPYCEECSETPWECTTLHTDCWNLYMRRATSADKMNRLWTMTSWRTRPWLECPPLRLLPETSFTHATSFAAEVCGLEGMKSLPSELDLQIWKYAGRCPMLRYSFVQESLDFLDKAAETRVRSMSLSQITSWSRGGSLVQSEDIGTTSEDRLITIDAKGIRSIKILRSRKLQSSFQNASTLYAIAYSDQNITVDFTLGMCRLRLGQGTHLQLCDIPFYISPPWRSPTLAGRTGTVDLSTSTGITFFIIEKRTILAIHAHTASMPTAMTTFQKLPRTLQEEAVWIYLPLPQEVEKSEPTVWRETPTTSDLLCRSFQTLSRQSMLVYRTAPYKACRILGLQLFDEPVGSSIPLPKDWEHIFEPSCESSIIMEDVASVRMFYAHGTRLLRGLLFRQKDGGQYAMGECRIGIDPSEEFFDFGSLRLRTEGSVVTVVSPGDEVNNWFIEGRTINMRVSRNGASLQTYKEDELTAMVFYHWGRPRRWQDFQTQTR